MDDWEVIVCDDASDDDTADVAESFGERFRVIRSEENTGPAGARNKALAVASGEFIALLDADDYWFPEYLAEQLAVYESSEAKKPGIGVVTCNVRILGPDGYAPWTLRDRFPFPRRATLAKLLARNYVHSAALIPRSIIEEVGGFSRGLFGTEDYDLWVRMFERGYRPVSNPKPLAVYRLRLGSASSNPAIAAQNWLKVHRAALERGRLGWWERWIARRELRVYRLVAELDEIKMQREVTGRIPVPRVLGAIPWSLAVVAQNPQRWLRVPWRVLSLKGDLMERLRPGRDWAVLRDS